MVKLAILGSTGSIGTQALDVVARHPDLFQVDALAGGQNIGLIRRQIETFHPRWVSVLRKEDADALKSVSNGSKVFWGEEGIAELVGSTDADVVLSAIVGAAGLKPTLQALSRGKTVALANKESMVIAGEVMNREASRSGARILPVDSEHSAIFQALSAGTREEVRRLILTASGGPFLGRARESLAGVAVEEALRHPNWQMGPKITIDSATLMNKGLELIEARWLFDFPENQIDVHIHPQSIVHSLVEYRDGSVIAQLGTPDMRCAIAYALAYPHRVETGVNRLSLPEIGNLSFFEPDLEAFPALKIAREVAREGGSFPAVLNAANEVAVDRFLKKGIGFLDITRIVEAVLSRHEKRPIRFVEDVLEADRWARQYATVSVKGSSL